MLSRSRLTLGIKYGSAKESDQDYDDENDDGDDKHNGPLLTKIIILILILGLKPILIVRISYTSVHCTVLG